MSFLNGAAAISGSVGGLESITNTLFPKQVLIKNPETNEEIYLDSTQQINTGTSITLSDHPAEDGQILTQNISKNPRTIQLACVLSNIIRLSNIRSLSEATKYASALLIPDIASASNLLLNEEDSVTQRLDILRETMGKGQVVQLLGVPGFAALNYIIVLVDDSKNVSRGNKSKDVTIGIREAFIVGQAAALDPEAGFFSQVQQSISGAIDSIPESLGELASGGIGGV